MQQFLSTEKHHRGNPSQIDRPFAPGIYTTTADKNEVVVTMKKVVYVSKSHSIVSGGITFNRIESDTNNHLNHELNKLFSVASKSLNHKKSIIRSLFYLRLEVSYLGR